MRIWEFFFYFQLVPPGFANSALFNMSPAGHSAKKSGLGQKEHIILETTASAWW
jgi:hypothetical protein